MSDGCSHHGHSHGADASTTRLTIVLVLAGTYFLAEVIGGLWTGSLALLADAGHMFSDMAALAISLFAAWMASRRPSGQQTFGYYRAEILAALVNGAMLFLVAGGILHEAWDRLADPQPILAGPTALIALGGLIVNLICLWVLGGGHHANLNVRGAWLHVLGDTLGSVGVLVSALLVWRWGWFWADPVASAAVCLLILVSAWRLLSEAMSVLMEHAPRDVDVEQVRARLLNTPHVEEVHCLHIWSIGSGLRAASAHVVIDSRDAHDETLRKLQNLLRDEFRLDHLTLQLEQAGTAECEQATLGACVLTAHRAHAS